MARRDYHRWKPNRDRARKTGRPKSTRTGVSVPQLLITAALVGTFGGIVWSMASKDGGGADDLAASSFDYAPRVDESESSFICNTIDVVDGDTFRCDGTRIRLQGIDAPETEGHCRPGRECAPGDPAASTANLRALVSRGTTECRATDTDRYGRTVARCTAGGTDLSCAQVRSGHAVLRYAPISC